MAILLRVADTEYCIFKIFGLKVGLVIIFYFRISGLGSGKAFES